MASGEELEAFEQARLLTLLRVEDARSVPGSLTLGREGSIKRFELGGRHLYCTTVEVAMPQRWKPVDDRAIAGVQRAVGVFVFGSEAHFDAAGRNPDGFADEQCNWHAR